MKKRVLSLIMAAMMLLPLAACGSSTGSAGSSNVSGSTSGTGSGSASAETYDWKVANVLAEGGPWDLGLKKFSELLDEKSDGRITLTVYSGGQLGSEKETMEALQMNSLDFCIGSSATLSNFTDSQTVWDLPYLFLSTDAARKTLDSDVGQGVLDQLSDVGIKGLSYWENGVYAIAAKKPIQSLADLKGLKVRAIESNLQADTYLAFGATAVVIAWGDVYTALQNGTCDAVSSTTIPNMYSAKFYEVAKYITKTEHVYSPAPLLMSQKLWDSLPSDIQQIVQEAADEARDYEREQVTTAMDDCQSKMEAAGCTFYDVDKTEWSAAVKDVYSKYVGDNGIDSNLVSSIQAEAAKYN